ncbi:peptidase T [Phaeobacter sp. B1627]|nr:peptidase T [Phaeobacter sp. B1627]TNJ42806.1 peptidase T [Phaeobacter sp. B1627]
MSQEFDTALETRLVRYAAIDSQSDENSASAPSTARQLDMLTLLRDELTELGAEEVELTEYGVVLATLPGTVDSTVNGSVDGSADGASDGASDGSVNVPTVGFLAHVDTAPQFNASGVKPRVIKGYNGGDISFPDDPQLVLSPAEHPYLARKVGHDLITASGTTLLGADDKAGVAILMTMAEHLLRTPGLRHGPIRLAFTPDEEIGRGVDPRLKEDLAADFAYTLDGGELGEIEYESFSADRAVVRITGVSIHPGLAKGKMVNAIHLASKIIQTLPQATLTPEVTDDREGFLHATDMRGGSSEMEIRFILRDFELEGLAAKGALLRSVCDAVQAGEPRAEISCEITPQYRNMRYWLETDMTPVDLARDACRDLGIEPISVPIRGGTDGSRLTELGTPTPNIFTGMQCIHGPLEWISVQDMALATRMCLKLAARAADHRPDAATTSL